MPQHLKTSYQITILAFLTAVILSTSGLPWARNSPTPKGGVWQAVFNGRDLSGWEAVGPGLWSIEDGALVMRRPSTNHGGGWLVSRKNYGDFVLRFQFLPGAHLFNTGVLIRDPGHAKVGRPAVNGFEIKLAQGDREENGNASIWYLSNAPIQEIPAQEWTSFEIRCQGEHITTVMNGRKMAETYSRRSYSGAIGFHLHGGTDHPEVRWRNVEIQELPPAPRTDQLEEETMAQAPGESRDLLKNLLPLAGNWTVHGGVLHGTAAEHESWTMAAGTYENFMLTFDYKLSTGGSAGVGFGHGREFRLADRDETYPSGSVPEAARAFITNMCLQRVYRPGAWNQARFYVHGDHVITFENLIKSAEGHTPVSGGGPIGFRVGSGSTVDFRNVEIKTIE